MVDMVQTDIICEPLQHLGAVSYNIFSSKNKKPYPLQKDRASISIVFLSYLNPAH
jgi:hypothetical protein